MITWKQWGRSKFCTWHDHCEHAQHCNSGPNESAERDITKWQQFRPVLTKNRSFWSYCHDKRNRGNKQSSPWALLFRCIVLFLLHKLCLSTCKGKYMWKIGELGVEELGSIIPPMRPHNLPWYWFATHIHLRPTQEGFCSWSMLQGHAPGAKVLRVYQRFHGYTSSSGAEFPPRKMLHNI